MSSSTPPRRLGDRLEKGHPLRPGRINIAPKFRRNHNCTEILQVTTAPVLKIFIHYMPNALPRWCAELFWKPKYFVDLFWWFDNFLDLSCKLFWWFCWRFCQLLSFCSPIWLVRPFYWHFGLVVPIFAQRAAKFSVQPSICAECALKFSAQSSICVELTLKISAQMYICAEHVDESVFVFSRGWAQSTESFCDVKWMMWVMGWWPMDDGPGHPYTDNCNISGACSNRPQRS